MTRVVLVAGASGVVGQAAIAAFAAAGDQVLALSRRVPALTTDGPERQSAVVHLPVDLRDPASVQAQAGALARVTHLVYAALYEQPGLIEGWVDPEQMAINDQMFATLTAVLCAQPSSLEQICLMQGTKAYGAHLHAIDVPAREDSPRDAHDNFYWLQEDRLRQLCAARDGLAYTIVRPQIVFGDALGSAMNLMPVIGCYGALRKVAGEPLHYPGGPFGAGQDTLFEATDALLLGRMLHWATRAPEARNRIFNVTNGEPFTFSSLWPDIAVALGMVPGEHRPLTLAPWLAEQADRYGQIQERLDLVRHPLLSMLGESHHYADALFAPQRKSPAPPALVSTVALRQAGFGECCDTRQMFTAALARLQAARVLPPVSWDGQL
jgi:nucleoside-diphosphate-sugar epimerase